MKNKKFLFVTLVLVLMVFSSSVCAFAVSAAGNNAEIVTDYQRGNVNLDGKINVRDATLIQKYIARLEEIAPFQVELADFTRNGKVNIKDATLIQKYVANFIQDPSQDTTETIIPETIDKDSYDPVVLPFVPAP